MIVVNNKPVSKMYYQKNGGTSADVVTRAYYNDKIVFNSSNGINYNLYLLEYSLENVYPIKFYINDTNTPVEHTESNIIEDSRFINVYKYSLNVVPKLIMYELSDGRKTDWQKLMGLYENGYEYWGDTYVSMEGPCAWEYVETNEMSYK